MEILATGLTDIHVHLDGSISFGTARKLAAMQGMEKKDDRALALLMSASPECRDLNEYLTKFEYPLSLLQTEEALEWSVCDLLKEQEAQGMIYSEIRFAPQFHGRRGLDQERAAAAALRGRARYRRERGGEGMKSRLILCCMRGTDNEAANLETVEAAAAFLDQGVGGLDLAGAEGLYPTENFKRVFERAVRYNVPFTIHAGEAAGPDSIWQALALGAVRIGHGVRCLEDRKLVNYLADNKIPLELCPTSNLNTRIFANIRQYPLPELMAAGILVTVNTDNMTVSGVTVKKELELAADTFGLAPSQINQLLINSIEGAFLPADEKVFLKNKIIATE